MYPDLSYILHALIGTAPDNATSIVKTLGLLMVLSFIFASWLLGIELRRKEAAGLLDPLETTVMVGKPLSVVQLLLSALIGFVVVSKAFYAIQHFEVFKVDPAAVILSLKGSWFFGILGALFFAGLRWWENKGEVLPEPREEKVLVYPHERIGDITVIAAVAGIVGAKIFAMVEDIDQVFSGEVSLMDFLSQFFSGNGLAVYGGFIVGFFAVFYYLRNNKMDLLPVLDAAAPALLIAFGIGRLGCHLSGDGDWGIPIESYNDAGELIYAYTQPGWLPDWLWSHDYAHNVINEGAAIADCQWRYCYQLEIPVFPTSIYEFVMLAALGGVLWLLRKRITIPGILFFLCLLLNGFERFWIEKIRVNDRYDILGFQSTQAEFISVMLMLIGLIGMAVLWKRWSSAKAHTPPAPPVPN